MLSERDGAKDVGGQTLLSVLLLDSLLPEGWGELEDPLGRPRAQEAEEVAEVGPGVDPVAGQERDEDCVDARALVAAEEEPAGDGRALSAATRVDETPALAVESGVVAMSWRKLLAPEPQVRNSAEAPL